MGNSSANSSRRNSAASTRVKSIWTHFDQQNEAKVLGKGSFGQVLALNGRADSKILSEVLISIDRTEHLGIGQQDDDEKDENAWDIVDVCSTVAVKLMERDKNDKTRDIDFIREVEALKRVKGHDNVIGYKTSMVDTKWFCIVSELCSGGELWEYMFNRIVKEKSQLNEEEVRRIIIQVLKGIQHCHNANVVHMDLKPENILLSSKGISSLKLVDFGCAKITHDANNKPISYDEFGGSLPYAAPELLKREPKIEGSALKCTDMWSLGVITYFLMSGNLPFDVYISPAQRSKQLKKSYLIRKKILSGSYTPLSEKKRNGKIGIGTSKINDFVNSLLRLNPFERMTASEALEHPWIYSNDIETMDHMKSSIAMVDPLSLYGKEYLVLKFCQFVLAQFAYSSTYSFKETQEEIIKWNNEFKQTDEGEPRVYVSASIIVEFLCLLVNKNRLVISEGFYSTLQEKKEAKKNDVEIYDCNNWNDFARICMNLDYYIEQCDHAMIDLYQLEKAFCFLVVSGESCPISFEKIQKILGLGGKTNIELCRKNKNLMKLKNSSNSKKNKNIRDEDCKDESVVSYERFKIQQQYQDVL